MTRQRSFFVAAFAAATLVLAVPPAEAAPPRSGGGGSHGGGHGGHRHHGGPGYGHGGHWGWGWSVAIGVPWVLGYYDPWYWGARTYDNPYYASGPYIECAQDEDCWRSYRAAQQPPPPTTQVPPAAIGPAMQFPAEGAPSERPLHQNYCEASRAWFPAVSTCASGWRMKRSAYD